MKTRYLGCCFVLGFLFNLLSPSVRAQACNEFTILHLNDLHSKLNSDGLGGIARHKTIIDETKKENPCTLVLDGGDSTEGGIFYFKDAGASVLSLMGQIGIDYTVLGNHEWLNGPDIFLDALKTSKTSMKVLSANLLTRKYERAEEFRSLVHPYEIREVDGVKIALLGLSTYEWIYDRFLVPLSVTKPWRAAHDLASRLKLSGRAHVVIALSHNSVMMNQAILKYAPDIDLIIGAHDHKKLNQPLVVGRWPWRKREGYIVEAGHRGHYLGKLNFSLNSKNEFVLRNYRLIQIDSSIPEDPEIKMSVAQLAQSLEAQMDAPIFSDQIAISKMDLDRLGAESKIGNLVVDSYLAATQPYAHLAMDSRKFIPGELSEGDVHTADVLNVVPSVYNPSKKRTWTLKVVPVSGRALSWFFHLLYSTHQMSTLGLVSLSGASLTYNPWFHSSQDHPFSLSRIFKALTWFYSGPSISGVQDIEIQGKPLDPKAQYRVALGEGIIEGIRFINSRIFEVIPLQGMEDTTIETWQVLRNYVQQKKVITESDVPLGNRIKTLQPDVGVYRHDITWTPLKESPEGVWAEVSVTVRNYGTTASSAGTPSSGPRVGLWVNENGIKNSVDPIYRKLAQPLPLDPLASGKSQTLTWQVALPKIHGLYPVTARIEGTQGDINHTNLEATRYFKLEKE